MKRRIAIVAGGLAAAVGLAIAPSLVQADDHGADGKAPSQTQLEKIKNEWTVEKMKEAKPLIIDPPKKVKPVEQAPGKPKIVKGTSAASLSKKSAALAETKSARWEDGGEVVKTTGKVFFEMGGDPYVCSASVVPAKNKSLVTTAGHCVNDASEQPAGTPGNPVTDFIFVPAYDGTASTDAEVAPYGVWPAQSITAHTLWAANREDPDNPGYATELWNYDVGFATLAPQNGQFIEDVVGSQDIGFNQQRGKDIGAFGYPAEPPYDGQELFYCAGTPADDENDPNSNDQGLDCGLNGGASGGPWFQDFDETTGTGVQVSVNSFTYLDQFGNRLDTMYGPYFGTAIQRFYEAVQD